MAAVTQRMMPLLVSLWLLAMYGLTLARTPTGYADSDALIAWGYGFKAAHPPGYPLLIGLIYGATNILPVISIAARANLLTAFLMALSGGLWVWVLERTVTPAKRWLAPLLTLVTFLSLPFWWHGSVTEVAGLMVFFLVSAWAVTLKLTAINPNEAGFLKWWGLWWVVIAGAVWHHQVLVLVLPGLGWMLWPELKQTSKNRHLKLIGIAAASTVAVSLVMAGLLALSLGRQMGWHWVTADGTMGLVKYVTRAIYSGVRGDSGEILAAYWSRINLAAMGRLGWRLVFEETRWVFGLGMMVLAGAGVITGQTQAERRVRQGVWLGLIAFLGLTAYIDIPLDPGWDQLQARMLAQRFYLPFWLMLGMPIFWGVNYLSLKVKKHHQLWLGLGLSLMVGWQILVNYQQISPITGSAWWANWLLTLKALPDQAAVVCFSDVSCFSLIYFQEVLGLRRDVAVLPQTPYLQTEILYATPLLYPDNPGRIFDWISQQQRQGKTVWLAEAPAFYQAYLGLDRGIWQVKEQGYLSQLGCNLTTAAVSEVEALSLSPWVVEQFRQEWQRRQTYQAAETCQPDETLAALAQNRSDLQSNLGWVLRHPDNHEARLGLAEAWERQGALAYAKREYAIVLDRDPTNASAGAGIYRLKEIEDLPRYYGGGWVEFD